MFWMIIEKLSMFVRSMVTSIRSGSFQNVNQEIERASAQRS